MRIEKVPFSQSKEKAPSYLKGKPLKGLSFRGAVGGSGSLDSPSDMSSLWITSLALGLTDMVYFICLSPQTLVIGKMLFLIR